MDDAFQIEIPGEISTIICLPAFESCWLVFMSLMSRSSFSDIRTELLQTSAVNRRPQFSGIFQTSSTVFRLLRLPDLCTEQLLGSQSLHGINGHHWTTHPLSWKQTQCSSSVMYGHSAGSVPNHNAARGSTSYSVPQLSVLGAIS